MSLGVLLRALEGAMVCEGWQRTKTGQDKRRPGAVELTLSGPVSPHTKSRSQNLGGNIRTMDGLLQNIQILPRED